MKPVRATGGWSLLLHGYPYDIHSYVEVAPLLAAQGVRVIVPYLRGHGSTRFLDAATPRAGQQGAIGADVIALMDALRIPGAVLAGFDWGGRAACVAAALWPERCKGLVSVNSYLIQDIARAMTPIPAKIESGLWYQYYFQTERGRAGLAADRRGVARVIWTRNSPSWRFDDATFERTATAFDNPDYVDVVIHSYRHRLGLAPGYPPYEEIERKLAPQPVITAPGHHLGRRGRRQLSRQRRLGDGGEIPRPTDPPPASGRRPQSAAGSAEGFRGRGDGADESGLIVSGARGGTSAQELNEGDSPMGQIGKSGDIDRRRRISGRIVVAETPMERDQCPNTSTLIVAIFSALRL